jgi:hypothetical protein
MARSVRAETFSDDGLIRGYHALAGGFDELVEHSGAIKAHWEPLLHELAELTPATRLLRMEQLNARVRETGIAHDLFADPASAAQPWRVDLVPLIVPPRSGGLLQRASSNGEAVRGHPGGSLWPAAVAGNGCDTS